MNLIEAIQNAGVVGAGGAGFPTHVKLAVHARQILLNGAECEPLLRVDQLAMQYQAARVVRGLELAMEAASAPQGTIATKAHYHEAVQALEAILVNKPSINLHLMDSYYPSGDEKAIIFEATGQVVPTGKLPIDLGCVVINVGTALGIADAADGKPVTDKSLTLCGDVPQPMTVDVPLGTPLQEVLPLCGFTGNQQSHSLIVGGPCMGDLIEDWDTPVTKTTGGLLLLPHSHPLILRRGITMERQAKLARAICCQCNRCTQLCPRHSMGLPVEPHKAMRAISTGDAELLGNAAGVLACSSCGLCTHFACEMGLSPSSVMAMLKLELGKAGVKPVPENRIQPEPQLALKNIPVQRLIARMGLSAYNRPAPPNPQTVWPRRVQLLLRQHVGKPSQPIVTVGQRVEKGQMIAQIPQGSLGAALHASMSGVVAAITEQSITLTSGSVGG